MKTAKEAEISLNEEAVITKDKRVGELLVTISEDSHALEDAQEELANAQKFLSNMKEECANKAKEKDARAKMRAQEVEAISEAINILNDDDALEVFKKTALVQQPQRVTYDALLQIRSSTSIRMGAKMRSHVAPVGKG